MLTDYVYSWLNNALDMGISEADFWEMTLAELERKLASLRRVKKTQAQEQASFDYILADLIGRSIGRIYSSSARIPEIAEVYPSLFDSKEIQEQRAEKQAELFALRLKQFANFHNNRIKGGQRKNNE